MTSPRRTSSRLASRTSARNLSSMGPSTRPCRDAAQFGQDFADRLGRRLALPEREIEFAVQRVKLLVHGGPIGLRLDRGISRAECRLRFFHGAEGTGGEEREDGRPQAGGIALRHQNRLAEYGGVPPI